MHRFVNQANISITTNRSCTLRCKHCYIEPELFLSKERMSKALFREVFDKVETLLEKDTGLEEIEWEVIGGETTMMPFEWWQEMLPYALDRVAQINKRIKVPGALNFLTNLIYSDQRYTALFNLYGDHPCFNLYTSWEPDTDRFGKRNQLFERFKKTLAEINTKKTLDVILTKEVVRLGPQYILDTFIPLGITDFSIKQLSPFGSGKAFFSQSMIDFKLMSEFLLDFSRLKPEGISFTPEEEMMSSLYNGTSYQCNGNFRYDISVEPSGECTFNANQTGSEAVVSNYPLFIDDEYWAERAIFENSRELNNKLTASHSACKECKYLRYCNGGWYHYKTAAKELIAPYEKEECAGFSLLWSSVDKKMGRADLFLGRSVHRYLQNIRKEHKPLTPVCERKLAAGYYDYFQSLESVQSVLISDQQPVWGKDLEARIWFYDALGIQVHFDSSIVDELPESVLVHLLCGDYLSVFLDGRAVQQWLEGHIFTDLARKVRRIKALLPKKNEAFQRSHTDLILGLIRIGAMSGFAEYHSGTIFSKLEKVRPFKCQG